MEARIEEGEPLYMATAELMDWSQGDTDEIYAFKVVRAIRYDALEAELADTRLMLKTHIEAGVTLREVVSEQEAEISRWKEAYDDAHAALERVTALYSTPSGETKP